MIFQKASKDAKKTKKVASAPSHPKYDEMIVKALGTLKERKGSSRQAILKHLLQNYKLGDNLKVVSACDAAKAAAFGKFLKKV